MPPVRSLSVTALLCLLPCALPAHDDSAHAPAHDSAAPDDARIHRIQVTVDEAGLPNPWNHLDFQNDPNAFQFAIVTDRTGGHRPGVFASAVKKLNLLQPEFVVSVGDLIEGYTDDATTIHEQWDELQGFIEQLDMPFFYLPGNHDISNPTMATIWQERLGRSYYSFVYRDVLFLCLDAQQPQEHHLSEPQQTWARETLAAHPDVRWTLVFLHSPLWNYADSAARGWDAIEEALADRPHTVFAGHVHSYLKSEHNDARYYTLATTGGASRLRGPAYGEFDQVAWITMLSDGPLVANLLLDGILDDAVRTPETRELVDQLQDEIFTAEVVWADESPASTERRLELRSRNASDQPVDVEFSLRPAAGLTLTLEQGLAPGEIDQYHFTLQPHDTRAWTVLLPASLPTVGPQALELGHLTWQAKLVPAPGADPLHLNDRRNLSLVRPLDLPPHSPITVDGDLSDWHDTTWYTVDERPHLQIPSHNTDAAGWRGPADSRFRLAAVHDDTHVYLAVEVFDDEVIAEPERYPWTQDGFEIRFDFRPAAERLQAHVLDRGLVVLASSPDLGDGFDPAYLTVQRDTPEGSRVCNQRTNTGYVLELALPVDELRAQFGDAWLEEGLRLNVAVNDRDQDGGQVQLWWQPDWRHGQNLPGSGTLFWR